VTWRGFCWVSVGGGGEVVCFGNYDLAWFFGGGNGRGVDLFGFFSGDFLTKSIINYYLVVIAT